MMMFYLDLAATARFVREAGGAEGEEDLGRIAAVLRVLGLDNIEAVLLRIQGRGADLVMNSALFAPAPRRGLWRCVDPACPPGGRRAGSELSLGQLSGVAAFSR